MNIMWKFRKLLLFSAIILAATSAIKLGQGVGSAYALQSEQIYSEKNECDGYINELTAQLKERALVLDEFEIKANERNAALQLGEKALQERLSELSVAEDNLRSTLSIADGAAKRDIEILSAIYEEMRSEDAARIFDIMTPEYSAGLLVALQPESSAAILSYVNPEQAYKISTIIAGRNTSTPKE